MSGSWFFLATATLVCMPLILLLSHFVWLVYCRYCKRWLKKIIIATISSVLKLFPPEASLINRFFTPSTSLVSLADTNLSCWIRSITAGIHSENIWDYGSLAERYSDPSFLLEISRTPEWRSEERTWSWYPYDSNWSRQSWKQFNQGQCYGRANIFLQRSTSSNLLLHQLDFNIMN